MTCTTLIRIVPLIGSKFAPFCGKTVGRVAKCRLFSHALIHFLGTQSKGREFESHFELGIFSELSGV